MSAPSVEDAVRALAELGVLTKPDAAFAAALVDLPEWSAASRWAAYLMLRKHRDALREVGIEYGAIEAPERPMVDDTSARLMARAETMGAAQKARAVPGRSVAWEGKRFVLRMPSPPDVAARDAVRALPVQHRRWDKDRLAWLIEPAAAQGLLDIVQRFGFAVDDGTADRLADAAERRSVDEERPRRCWRAEDGGWWVRTPTAEDPVRFVARSVAGAHFDRDVVAWHFPAGSDYEVERLVNSADLWMDRREREAMAEAARPKAVKIDASRALEHSEEIDFGQFKGDLMPFQRAGVAYAVQHASGRALIGDDMGLGKTRQALAAIGASRAFPALIVTRKSLVLPWLREIDRTMPDVSVSMWDTGSPNRPAHFRREARDGGGVRRLVLNAPADVMVVNLDIVAPVEASGRSRGRLGMADRLRHAGVVLRGLVLDESHDYKTTGAARTKAAKALAAGLSPAEGAPEGLRLLLTGTAIVNRPSELIAQLDILGRLAEFGGKATFERRYCNPPEAPIWMGDLSFKPLGEVQVGDEVVGWKRGGQPKRSGKKSQATLCKARVLAIHRRRAPLVRVTLESGRVVRCTTDHLWLSASDTGHDHFVNPKVGKRMVRVIDPSPRCSDERLAGWVAGLYDGEGTRDRIAQSTTHNPEVVAHLRAALTTLGIPFTTAGGEFTWITGGRQGLTDFVNIVRPLKHRPWMEDHVLTCRFRNPDRIVSVEPDGEGEVIAMTTTTGNYVAWGYASRNCDARPKTIRVKGRERRIWVADGATNLEELHERLRASCYVRRRKMDVLTELPPVQRVRVEVPIDAERDAEYRRAVENVTSWASEIAARAAREEGASLEEALRRGQAAMAAAEKAETMRRITAMRMVGALGKVAAVSEWVREFLADSDGTKVILFAYHQAVQEAYAREFPDAVKIVSGGKAANAEAERRFQEEPDCRLVLVSIAVGAAGLTLTAAEHIVWAELPWRPGDVDQGESRAWGRLNDPHGVTSYYMMGTLPGRSEEERQSYDFDVAEVLDAKRGVKDVVLDGAEGASGVGVMEAEEAGVTVGVLARMLGG